MFRRWSLGLTLSVAVHALSVGGLVGWALLRGAPDGPVSVEVMGMRLEDLKDLPLGPPPGAARAGERARARPRARGAAADDAAGALATGDDKGAPRAGEGDAEDDAEAARVSDVRQLGPEGSRLTVLLRLDRLKVTPFAAAVDALLMRLPDRRDLLEGTGLSLYDDFDAMLVATPNPRDYTATFLAVRHRVTDAALRAAVDRGARATGRVIAWRTEGGRPYGERRARRSAAPAPGVVTRDDRIIVLPAPGLVVVTPPAYRALLLAPRRASAPDGGAEDDADGGPAGDAGAALIAPSWRALLRRIDAQDGLLPPDGIALISAVDVLKAVASRDTALLAGLDMPGALTAVLGANPDLFVDVDATFASEAQARGWEQAWPGLQRKLRTNPLLVISGFSSLVGRVTLERQGRVVRLHETASVEETARLLQLVLSAAGG